MGDPQCPSCRARCDARDLQPNVSLRELADKYNSARSEVIRLVVREQEQKKTAASIAADEAEAAPARKKARIEGPVVVKNNAESAPRRSLRRSAAGRAKEQEAAQQKETAAAARDDDSVPGPSTRSTRSRTHAKGESSAKTNKLRKEEVDIDNENCIEILSEEEEEEEIKEEERTVDYHDEDFDFTMEIEDEEEEEGNEDDDEECSPSPLLKKQRTSQQKQPPGPGAASSRKPADASTPQGFVPCPICGKSVPSFYINSHVDTCLSSSGGGVGLASGFGSSEDQSDRGLKTNYHNAAAPLIPPPDSAQLAATVATTTQNKSNLGSRMKPSSPRQDPYIPLAVPSCLVLSLASDKIIRAALKKYNLPSDGKKSEMFDRYTQFRTAVLTANDRQERTSYGKIAQKMAAQERQRAAAALLGSGLGNGNTNGQFGAGTTAAGGLLFRQGTKNHRFSSAITNKNSKNGNFQKRGGGGDPMVLQGDSFEELIAVTKARDAARRAARAAAAAAEEEEKDKEENVDRFNTFQQHDSFELPPPTSPVYQPPISPTFSPKVAEPPAAAPADAVPNTREEMLAEEVRQAHEIGLLDSDDDNW
jgi:hypothetical protein